MLETPYASNSWALGPWARAHALKPWAGPQRCTLRRKRGPAQPLDPVLNPAAAAPRLRLAASGARPKAWAQGPMGPAHGPRAHELEAYGVSSIRGF